MTVLLFVVFCGFSCHGGENACGEGSGDSQEPRFGSGEYGFFPGLERTTTPSVSNKRKSAGVKARDGVLRLFMLKGPDPDEPDLMSKMELRNVNTARMGHKPPLPPVDMSGNVVEGWDMTTVKMGFRNYRRYLEGLPPIK